MNQRRMNSVNIEKILQSRQKRFVGSIILSLDCLPYLFFLSPVSLFAFNYYTVLNISLFTMSSILHTS